jgi:hypothetical protein
LLSYAYPVSLFDENFNFRGAAVFESKQEAQSYMEKYSEKMAQRVLGHLAKSKTTLYISDLKLRIFEESTLPAIGLPKSAPAPMTTLTETEIQID